MQILMGAPLYEEINLHVLPPQVSPKGNIICHTNSLGMRQVRKTMGDTHNNFIITETKGLAVLTCLGNRVFSRVRSLIFDHLLYGEGASRTPLSVKQLLASRATMT